MFLLGAPLLPHKVFIKLKWENSLGRCDKMLCETRRQSTVLVSEAVHDMNME